MRTALFIGLATLVVACVEPVDRRPGLWLSGEVAPAVEDWSFANDHPEIFVEVKTPYGVRYSITVVCASLEGALYMGARNPTEKRWVGYVARDPDVRLKIGDQIYRARMTPIEDADGIALALRAYARKYDRHETPAADAPPVQYFSVMSRD